MEKPATRTVKTYHTNGNLASEINYLNNLLHGTSSYFYDNNNLRKKAVFKNGLLVEPVKTYYQNGNIDLEFDYADKVINGNYTITYHDEKGNTTGFESYKDEELHGTQKVYENHNLVRWRIYEKGKLIETKKDLINEKRKYR